MEEKLCRKRVSPVIPVVSSPHIISWSSFCHCPYHIVVHLHSLVISTHNPPYGQCLIGMGVGAGRKQLLGAERSCAMGVIISPRPTLSSSSWGWGCHWSSSSSFLTLYSSCLCLVVVPPVFHPTSSCSWGWGRVVHRLLAFLPGVVVFIIVVVNSFVRNKKMNWTRKDTYPWSVLYSLSHGAVSITCTCLSSIPIVLPRRFDHVVSFSIPIHFAIL